MTDRPNGLTYAQAGVDIDQTSRRAAHQPTPIALRIRKPSSRRVEREGTTDRYLVAECGLAEGGSVVHCRFDADAEQVTDAADVAGGVELSCAPGSAEHNQGRMIIMLVQIVADLTS